MDVAALAKRAIAVVIVEMVMGIGGNDDNCRLIFLTLGGLLVSGDLGVGGRSAHRVGLGWSLNPSASNANPLRNIFRRRAPKIEVW